MAATRASHKGRYEDIVLAEDAQYLTIDATGADWVTVTRTGPNFGAIARVGEKDYVTLED